MGLPWIRDCFKTVGWGTRRTTKGSELPQQQRSPTSFAMGFETAPKGRSSSRKASSLGMHSPLQPSRTIWHPSAPKDVREATRAGQDADAWTAWRTHLAERSRPMPFDELVRSRRSPLAWALTDGVDVRSVLAILDEGARANAGRNRSPSSLGCSSAWLSWLALASRDVAFDEKFAVETLAWCHALPRLATNHSAADWWASLNHLIATVNTALQNSAQDRPLVHQLLAGEAPLLLAYLFPEIAPCRQLGTAARQVLSAGLIELLDGQGLPHSRHIGLLRPLLACWTRCRAMGNEIPGACWSEAAQTQYEWLVPQRLAMDPPGCAKTLSRGSAGRWDEDLFRAAIRLGGDDDDRDIAELALPRAKGTQPRRTINMALPQTSAHSEWAQAAVLRPGWLRSDPQLSVIYPDGRLHAELQSARNVLISAAWDIEIRCDGRTSGSPAEWEEVCWISDETADYLELEAKLESGLRVERQILMAREDRFLFLADAVVGVRQARLEYRGVLPLSNGISLRPAAEWRDGVLAGKKALATVLPLALPEWRSDHALAPLSKPSEDWNSVNNRMPGRSWLRSSSISARTDSSGR